MSAAPIGYQTGSQQSPQAEQVPAVSDTPGRIGPVLTRYREVLHERYVGRLLGTSIVARAPQGMSGLAMVLFLTPQVGYGRAGLATGLSIAGAGVSNVVLARGVDRLGARRVITPAAFGYAAAMVGLAASGHEPYGVQLAICLVIGLVTPPITSVSRGLWPTLLGEERAQVLYGLEATAQELVYIAGPAAVALIAGLAGARTAVIVSGVTGLVGAVAFVTAPPLAARPGRRVAGSRWVSRRILGYAVVGTCLTVGLGMTEIATVDFVGGRRASAGAGIVLAVWSVGSMIGGLTFGAARHPVTDRSLSRVVMLAAAGLALGSLAPGSIGLATILLLSGAAIAPTMARLYSRIGAAAGEGSTTEAFGWLALGFLTGASLGAALGGLAVDSVGPRWTFALSGAAALCAVPVIAAQRPVGAAR
jgi:predicted MFS family arabinose efflux permease